MLLSFSIDEMRPMIVNGLKELAGEPVDGRVKRQTIRRFGPQYMKKFGTAKHLEGLQLDLWWKGRTPNRFKFGQVTGSGTLLKLERTAENHILVTGFEPLPELVELSVKDGFNTVDEFLDYFVPNNGDVFEGVLFRW